jgi:hypothetical protein
MPGMHIRLLAILLTLSALLLAACGDDDGGSGGGGKEDDAITKVLQDGLTSKDPKVVCGGSLSTDFMQRVYGGEDKCVSVETENLKEDDDQADSVDVSDIEVDGEKATATVAIKGGSNDGSKGPIDLVKQGESWRVNDLSVELLRSQLETAVTEDEELSKETLDCVKEKLLDLDDAELKKVAYGAIGEQPAAQQQFVELVTTCDPGLVRRQIEDSVADSLEKQGASEKQIDCVKKELRERISDEELNKAAGEGGNTDALQQGAAKAVAACGVSGS